MNADARWRWSAVVKYRFASAGYCFAFHRLRGLATAYISAPIRSNSDSLSSPTA
jgi:hypothetical protein